MTDKNQPQKPQNSSGDTANAEPSDMPATTPHNMPKEFGGSGKAEPTRFGDWEVAGRCSDF